MHDDFIQLLPFFFFSPVVGGWGREEEINGQCVRKQTHVWILKFVVKHWRWQLLYVLTFTSICGLGWYIIIIKQMGLGGLHNKRLKSSFVLQLPNSLEAAGVPTLLPAWNFGMYIYHNSSCMLRIWKLLAPNIFNHSTKIFIIGDSGCLSLWTSTYCTVYMKTMLYMYIVIEHVLLYQNRHAHRVS